MTTESTQRSGTAVSAHNTDAERPASGTPPRTADGSIKTSLQRLAAGFRNYYTGPLADAHLMVTLCIILSILGVVMVLDASGPASLRDYGNYYSVFIRQCIFMIIGWVGFYIALRVPFSLLRKIAFPLYLLSIVLLILVAIPGIGQERNGARSWFDFGPVAFQPSELAKVIIIMVVALYLGQLTPMSKIGDTLRPMGLFIPVIVLVILQKDLGMAVTCGVVLLAFLFFGRLPGSVIWITAGGAAVLFLILTLTTGFRTDRLITYWHQLTGGSYDAQGVGYQARQAQLALADGGFTGVGLGQSRAKYFYLPEAPNDFIFAIIGEELGFIGALVVAVLYTVLGFVGLRIARRVLDPSLRLIACVGTTSVVVQAFINMGYVVGLFPVTGLQLPLISAGGSATVTTLFLLGLITSTARHERAAIAAISTGSGKFGRALRLPVPPVYAVDDTPDFGRFTNLARWMVGEHSTVDTASRSTDPRWSHPRPGPPRAPTPSATLDSPRGSSASWQPSRKQAASPRDLRTRGNEGLSVDPRSGETRPRMNGGDPARSSRPYPADAPLPPWESRPDGPRTLPPLERPQGRRWNPPSRGSGGDSRYGGPPPA